MSATDNIVSLMSARKAKPIPMQWGDTTNIAQAAFICGVSGQTMRRFCREHGIGKQVRPRGNWIVSRPAAKAIAVADMEALEAMKNGDRTSALVAEYFRP